VCEDEFVHVIGINFREKSAMHAWNSHKHVTAKLVEDTESGTTTWLSTMSRGALKPRELRKMDCFKVAVILAAFALAVQSATSFSAAATPSTPKPFGGLLDSIFGSDPAAKEREDLKGSLLEECREQKPSRERIEALISDLVALSPTPDAASSPRLQKKWIL